LLKQVFVKSFQMSVIEWGQKASTCFLLRRWRRGASRSDYGLGPIAVISLFVLIPQAGVGFVSPASSPVGGVLMQYTARYRHCIVQGVDSSGRFIVSAGNERCSDTGRKSQNCLPIPSLPDTVHHPCPKDIASAGRIRDNR